LSGGASLEVANLTGRLLTLQQRASPGAGTNPVGRSVQASELTVSSAPGSLTGCDVLDRDGRD
jgi:hypothetical protein